MCFLERVETKTTQKKKKTSQNSHSGNFLWVSFLVTKLKHKDNNGEIKYPNYIFSYHC